ncbi:MAG: DJ-1/PfpI family protein [Candidatus Omnitrophota bacterium]
MMRIKVPGFRFQAFLLSFCALVFISCAYAQDAAIKQVVMIIPRVEFRDDEFFPPKQVLEKEGILVKVASSTLDEAKGSLGARVKPDMLFTDVNMGDFDAVIFIGGEGSTEYWDNPFAHKLARNAVAFNKIVAAICIAPITLGKAGILKGKRATVHPSQEAELKALGADYTGRSVEKDGNIITANGPSAAVEFGVEILRALKY